MISISADFTPAMPKTVRAAAWLLGVYGIAVLVNAVVMQSMNGWVDAADFLRAVPRACGCLLLA